MDFRDSGADPHHNFWAETFAGHNIADEPARCIIHAESPAWHFIRLVNLKTEGRRIVRLEGELVETNTKLLFRGPFATSETTWRAVATFYGNRGRSEAAQLTDIEIHRNDRPSKSESTERVLMRAWCDKGIVDPKQRKPDHTYMFSVVVR